MLLYNADKVPEYAKRASSAVGSDVILYTS